MAYKTRREARYSRLRDANFLPFEARPLSKIPPRVCPYLGKMVGERKRMATIARRQGRTTRQFEASIKELYKLNGWLKRNRKGKIVADPWKMLRDHEDKYKARHPEYDSPWEKRWKDWRDYQRKDEATRKRQLLQQ